MNDEQKTVVEGKIGYKFTEKSLLQQAFVRKSYGVENDCAHNEVLEFIGDKVLDLVVVQLLVEEHCSMTMGWDYHMKKMWLSPTLFQESNVLHSNKTEGELTEIKKALVQRKNLARRIDELDIVQYIVMNQSDIDNHVYENASVKEDLFEAILGAVAIDCKWDMKVMKQVVDQMLQPDLSEQDDNYISELQEWSLKKYGVLPDYIMKPYSTAHWYIPGYIYDMSRHRQISASSGHIAHLSIQGVSETILGFGNTQSEARQDAARYALKVLEKRGLLINMRDEIEEPSLELAINQLEILARRGYFPLPEYDYEETHDADGNPVWSVRCYIDEYGYYETVASSKKQAKKLAAYDMLLDVLENYEDE